MQNDLMKVVSVRDFTSQLTFGVVILAAGASRRMGQPKMLLPWGTTTVVGQLIGQWRQLGASQIAVVCAANDLNMQAELDRLGFPREDRIYNPQPEQGMFSSIRCAAAWGGWREGLTHWAIVLGDQPHLRQETLRALIEFVAAHPDNVCQPVSEAHARHPVICPRHTFGRLANSSAEHLKAHLQKHAERLCYIDLADPGFGLDIDRPADYQAALRLFRSHS